MIERAARPDSAYPNEPGTREILIAPETNMTALICEEKFSQADAIVSTKCRKTTDSAGFLEDAPIANPQEEWETRLRSLQEWICELLIKNQQLRMELMKMKASRAGD